MLSYKRVLIDKVIFDFNLDGFINFGARLISYRLNCTCDQINMSRRHYIIGTNPLIDFITFCPNNDVL